MCAIIIAHKIQLENSKFTFVNKLMEQKEDTLTVTRQSSALAEAEKSSNYVNISQKIVNELLSSIHSNMLKEVYTKENKELLSITIRLTDWSSLVFRLHRLGPVLIDTLEQSQYLLDCRKL